MDGNHFSKHAGNNDEFYTPDSKVEQLLEILPQLRGHRVWSPASHEWSAFAKFLSAHAEEYGYEYRASGTDMFTSPNLDWADLVVDNLPYSKQSKFIKQFLAPRGIDYILLVYPLSYAASNACCWWGYENVVFSTPTGVKKLPVEWVSTLPVHAQPEATITEDKGTPITLSYRPYRRSTALFRNQWLGQPAVLDHHCSLATHSWDKGLHVISPMAAQYIPAGAVNHGAIYIEVNGKPQFARWLVEV